ncbi:YIF1-domain-containing protein [Teratosphaeria nubilosa]|uniref:Protein YIF1 n=1 Tax=Teratosphaeria nubilosa TaxID=161662 RepID=A0A6G1LM86_9PEZI|nr:YIF1-domain-containing protein [Teratosphaeria nubilosa]
MQRPAYSMPPAQSPPLHHPVPQHVSTVPQLRSPPPPAAQSQTGQYAYGQPPPAAPGANYMPGAPYMDFMRDPTAQMGMHMGQQAMKVGQEYVEQNINRFVNVTTLKHYFNVSNRYVLTKLYLVLFPWRHRPWSRTSQPAPASTAAYLPPREDVNAPDMYIPLMAFVTYILLSTLIAGLNGKFEPQLLGITFSNASVIIILELVVLWLGRYFLNINSESQIYDLVAYSGYKFVGVIVTIAIAAIVNGGKGTGGWVGWVVFGYTFLANAFFLLRSLKYVLLPTDNTPNNPNVQVIARSQRSRRTNFLFVYSYLVQFVFMWWLSALDIGSTPAKKA